MASVAYNAGMKAIADRSVDFLADTIKIMLIGIAVPYTFSRNHAVMTVPAASELNVGGYVPGFAGAGRLTLAGKSITNDTTNNRTIFDATDPAAWTLAAGDSVAAAIIYKHLTSDAVAVPLWFLDHADTPTNGSTFQEIFDALGIYYIQH